MAKKVTVTLILILLAAAVYGRGQIAAELEGLLEQKEVSCGQAASFALAMTSDDEPGSPAMKSDAAFALVMERGWLPASSESGGPITMSGLSLLVMKAFDMKGGLMYRWTENPRYAYRELKYKGIIEGRAYSGRKVSGEQFLQIMGNVMSYIEEAQ